MKRLILVAFCSALGACSGSDHEELKKRMADNTKDMRGRIPTLPEVKAYEPVPYDVVEACMPSVIGEQQRAAALVRTLFVVAEPK